MKRYFIVCCCLLLANRLTAQNVGIGTTAPTAKLEIVNGGFLVNEATSFSNTPPTASQTITMMNGMTHELPADDSVGRVYDPGGFFGDYAANTQATVNIQFASFPSVGFQFVLEDLQLGAGDSLIIISLNGIDQPSFVIKAFTGAISAPVTFTSHSKVRIIFKSNGDASVGRGFSLLVRKLVKVPGASGVTNFFGNHFFFDPVKGALRMNTHYDDSIGLLSVAMGGASASGYNAIALGSNAVARGPFSIALGGSISEGNGSFSAGFSAAQGQFSTAFGNSIAEGERSFAAGSSFTNGTLAVALGSGRGLAQYAVGIGQDARAEQTRAHAYGNNVDATAVGSFAIGNDNTSTGTQAFAIGNNVTSDGTRSIALGNYVSTSGFDGCLTIGDASTTTVMQTFVDNGFRSRFAGGYRLFTNSAVTVGAFLNANANAWAALSDVRLKENFIAVDGESFLKKIAAMPQYTWNYIGQDVQTLRHYGPMAQDFYNAFGKDSLGEIGCDTLINQQDFLGVNLIAIQALEKRTREMEEIMRVQAARIEKLEAELKAAKIGRNRKARREYN